MILVVGNWLGWVKLGNLANVHPSTETRLSGSIKAEMHLCCSEASEAVFPLEASLFLIKGRVNVSAFNKTTQNSKYKKNPSRWSHRDNFNDESQHGKHIWPPKCELLRQGIVKAQNQQQGAVIRAFTSGGSGQSMILFFGPGRQLAPCLAHYRRCCFNSVRKKNLTRQQTN